MITEENNLENERAALTIQNETEENVLRTAKELNPTRSVKLPPIGLSTSSNHFLHMIRNIWIYSKNNINKKYILF